LPYYLEGVDTASRPAETVPLPPAVSASPDPAAPRTELTPTSIARAAFERSPTGLLLLSAGGVIQAANPSACRMLNTGRYPIVGLPVWDAIAAAGTAEDVAWCRHAFSVATTDEMADPALEHDLERSDQASTTAWTIRPLDSTDDGMVAVAEGRDVTASRRASTEAQLADNLALAFSHTDSLESAIAASLKVICDASGCVLGEAWLSDARTAEGVLLSRAGAWSRPDRRLESFIAQGAGFRFLAGQGLPGTAWQRRELVSASPLSAADEFTRAPLATAAGLRAAVAIPVLVNGEPVAVVSCYTDGAHLESAWFSRVAAIVAVQLGPLLHQKKVDDARRIAEAQLAGAVAIALDAIISIDDQRRIIQFNWGAERIFGYSAEDALGQSLDMLLPEELRARHAVLIASFARSAQTARQMGERSAIVGRRKSGEVFPAEASISRYMAGGKWMFTVMLRDITDRRRAEDSLRFLAEVGSLVADLLHDQAALQRAAARAVPMLADTCIIDLVEGDQILTGAVAARDPDTVRAIQADRDARPLSWDVATPVTDAMRTRLPVLIGDATGVTAAAPPRDGATSHDGRVAATAVPCGSLFVVPLEAHDQIVGAATFTMMPGGRKFDDSYRALAEAFGMRVALAVDSAALYQRARRAIGARDEALAVVSHDLRNPLSAIALCVGALRESPPPAADVTTELLGTVADSTTLMRRIIQDLLDVASIDAGQLSLERRPQPVLPVLEHAIAMFRVATAESGVSIVLDRESLEGMPDADIDTERIIQVVANLLHNAVKFTDRGGSVYVSTTARAGRVEVSVRDTGAGIPAVDLPHIFDRFWHDRRTAKIRSTGLGLAIARGIIEAHGGRIWAASIPGRGSSFHFEILVAAAHAADPGPLGEASMTPPR
jgi:PAS domain S-box-containing protein